MGNVISFAQQKGGAGKTTVLAHLAHAAALSGASVALIDFDPQASLSRWAQLAKIDGLDLLETASYRASSDIRDAAKQHDLTLVDCPGSAASVLEAAIRESDLVIVPCQASAMDIWASEPSLKMCDKLDTPARILLNRVPPRGMSAEDAARVLKREGATILRTRLGNRVAFSRGIAEGTTALGLSGQTAAKAEIAALQKEIHRNLKKLT